LVNCLLIAAAGALWFNAARLAGGAAWASILAVLAVLTSRWAAYAAGTPLTDSLYLLVFGLAYFAYRRGRGAGWAVAAALVLGPLSKESFVFLLPWLCWYGRPALPWVRQLLALAAGGFLLVGVHYFVDTRTGAPASAAVSNAFEHLENITYSLRRAASPKGLGELLSIFGLFTLIPVACFIASRWPASSPTAARPWHAALGWAEGLFVLVVAVHMLLSGDLGRMGFLAAPAFVASLALAFSHWRSLFADRPGPGFHSKEGQH
jgi:hypothetical protein